MNFEQVVETVKSAYNLYIRESDVLVVSVSTGVDSMVLFEVLQKLDTKLHVVHFNHHKRSQSQTEAQFICDYCKERLIEYTEFDVPEFNQNFQNNARTFRHQQLCEIANQYTEGIIVTAHHFDDQVETYIQRIFSGSSLLNRKMMPIYEQRDKQRYFRPFVGLEKTTIIQAAEQNGIQYFEDESNQENSYLRNKIRNNILPIVSSVFPAYRKALANDFKEIEEIAGYFEERYNIFFQSYITVEINKAVINKKALIQEHNYFQGIVFERILKQLGISLKRQHYTNMKKILQQQNGQIQLKRDVFFIVEKERVTIEKKQAEKLNILQEEYFLTEGLQKLPKQENLCYNNGYTSCQDILEIEANNLPFLRVRYYQTGDKVEIGNYHKLVRRLFIDQKLPRVKREHYPIVEDVRTNEIIWIPTMYKAHSKKANEKEDIIQIYFNDGGFYA